MTLIQLYHFLVKSRLMFLKLWFTLPRNDIKGKERYYRIVPLETFLKVFASDRSHMKMEDNTWIAPPPDYPPISSKESKMNLPKFISMSENLEYGTVLDEQQFKEFCDLTQ
ncbi:hypothetical protein Glove_100g28 [Diversispora epigaea]|uniref:Protein N-terminal glutamine amidohydrolase n=1 Tax=Diversispora epigaea TaxID=1348612 RepID=A0A397J7L0_9GLOM|nr:hypothetical protein Glove_100g28 [Diversispora epigaea]